MQEERAFRMDTSSNRAVAELDDGAGFFAFLTAFFGFASFRGDDGNAG